MKSSELPYDAPTPISLMPDTYLGDVDFYEQQTRINNGKEIGQFLPYPQT